MSTLLKKFNKTNIIMTIEICSIYKIKFYIQYEERRLLTQLKVFEEDYEDAEQDYEENIE